MSGPSHWRARPFTCVGGALCLDFANTAAGRTSKTPMERLSEQEAIVAFAVQTGTCDPADRRALLTSFDAVPDALADFIALREAIYRLMQHVAAGTAPVDDDVLLIEEFHRQSVGAARLRLVGGRPSWFVPVRAEGGLLVADAIVRSVLELLGHADPYRLRFCPRDNCGFVFLDTSKSGRRRWCDMKVCGNRAKAARFAERAR